MSDDQPDPPEGSTWHADAGMVPCWIVWEALHAVYVAAARLRQFPVPFSDHVDLVDAVDHGRSVLDPPDDPLDARPSPPLEASAWQTHVAAYPRTEFLAAFREVHATLHRLWTEAVGTPGYDKTAWQTIDNALGRFARVAAAHVGIPRTEPLL